MIKKIKNKILISLKHNKKTVNLKTNSFNFNYTQYFNWAEGNTVYLNLKKKNILKKLINDNKKKKK